jgi:hypothetical protein
MMGNAGWPEDWEERKAGKGCTMCISREVDDNGYGIRFLRGRYADVFLTSILGAGIELRCRLGRESGTEPPPALSAVPSLTCEKTSTSDYDCR